MKKIYDLSVKVGSYTKHGEKKNRWKTVGAVIKDDDGGMFMMLDRSFNPAGVPFKEGSESILVSMFEPKDKDAEPVARAAEKTVAQDDDIPF